MRARRREATGGSVFSRGRVYNTRTRKIAACSKCRSTNSGGDWQGLNADLLFHVLLALAVVVIVGHLLGRALATIGQPPVIGEVVSGILLGPSLLGRLLPAGEAYLFPESVRPALGILAQLGVVLYMF